MPRKRTAAPKDVPENKQIFRCWIEILELKTGLKRELPLKGIRKVYIPRKKKHPSKPDEELLLLEDGETEIEAKDLNELAAQLRQRYPDTEYERRLFKVRDREAERRYADAMNGLIDIIAKAAVDDYLREDAAKHPP
jgi:hypothetical protein